VISQDAARAPQRGLKRSGYRHISHFAKCGNHRRDTGTNNVTNLREFTVTSAGIAPWLLNASLSGGGGVQFDLLASPNQSFRLQGSSNLVDWLDLLNFTPTNSPVILQDNSSLPHRFYRAVSP
jgi:hypothetical protein